MRALIAIFGIVFNIAPVNYSFLDRRSHSTGSSLFVERELEEKKKKNRKKQKQYKNKKFKKRRDYRQKYIRFLGTKSKSHRHSNQKQLRRMYRNC